MRKGSGKGYRINNKGYVQVIRRGLDRWKYVHRLAVAKLCREFCFHVLSEDGLPAGFDVHHIDFDKQHNCPGNLLLIEHALHYHMDVKERRNDLGIYVTPQPITVPEGWVAITESFTCPDCQTTRKAVVAIEQADAVPNWVMEEEVV